MNLFNRTTAEGEPRGGLLSAYRNGRKDERAKFVHDNETGANDPGLRAAYERGRREGAGRRRRGFPLLTVLVVLIALAGGTAFYLAAQEGSFAAGGRLVDQQIAKTQDRLPTVNPPAKPIGG